MAKIKLGVRPKTFKHTVTVPMLEGGTASVQLDFIYRTRPEFGEFVDNVVASAKVDPPANQSEDAVMFSLKRSLEESRETNAEYILQIAEGWNLDVPFDLSSVRQLCDEVPGAALAIIAAYRAALVEGRLGN